LPDVQEVRLKNELIAKYHSYRISAQEFVTELPNISLSQFVGEVEV
jgi:hypothetical protein